MPSQTKTTVFQFGPFELDPAQQELRRRGLRLRLPGSRLRLLHLLVSQPGHLISRDEIAAVLWKDTQTVDVVSGINTAVNQLRAQLGDDPASPKYIETVIGAGYRFIAEVAEVEAVADSVPAPVPLQIVMSEEGSLPTVIGALPARARQGPATATRPSWLVLALASGLLASGLLIAAALYLFLRVPRSPQMRPIVDLDMVRITGDGDIDYADISPDGKYVAYVRAEGGRQSLWLKQLATGRVLKLAAMGKLKCQGLAFSPEGDYVYFMRKEPLEPSGELYRVPFLGGNPTQVLTGISGRPAISPDGRRIAFVRSTLLTHGEDSIVTASMDGSGERVLASFHAPGVHMNRITWSADARSLIFPLQSTLYSIAAEGGTAQPIRTDHAFITVDDLRSLPSTNDLLVVGLVSGFSHKQIYEVSLPEGKIHAITHDLANYTAIRATSDGKSLLAVQDLVLDSIQVLGPGQGSQVQSLSAENQNRDGVEGLTWTPDGKILYSSEADDRGGLMKIQRNGSDPLRIATADADAAFSDLAVSPRGDFLALTRWQADDVANLWRTDMNGAHPRQLTTGEQDFPFSITPDGAWVVYSSVQGDDSFLMKAPSEGGHSVRLTDYYSDNPSVSPDGKWIACSYIAHNDQQVRLAIVPITGGPPAKIFDFPENATPRHLSWTPDSRSVAFVNHVSDVDNVWEQPLAGGPPVAVTHFDLGKIFNFQSSRDGRIVLARGTESIDAVLIRNFRETSR